VVCASAIQAGKEKTAPLQLAKMTVEDQSVVFVSNPDSVIVCQDGKDHRA